MVPIEAGTPTTVMLENFCVVPILDVEVPDPTVTEMDVGTPVLRTPETVKVVAVPTALAILNSIELFVKSELHPYAVGAIEAAAPPDVNVYAA